MAEKNMEKRELKVLETLGEDSRWISEHYDKLRKHEGKVIAVKNKKILHVSESLEELFTELESKKENSAFVLIATIPPKSASFIL